MYSRQASVWLVKPGGTGRPALVISARPAPLPPRSSRILPLPSADPLPKKKTYWEGARVFCSWPIAWELVEVVLILFSVLPPQGRVSIGYKCVAVLATTPSRQQRARWGPRRVLGDNYWAR